jgi:conjugative transfer signal peptidase TraF
MKVRSRVSRPARVILGLLLALKVALMAAYAAGVRVNATASMPEGVYRLQKFSAGPIGRGTVVAVCPSPAVIALAAPGRYLGPGPCPGNVEPLLKHVAAVAGDRVDVSEHAVRVNGLALPDSGRFARDCAGRSLSRIPAGHYTIASNRIWLYGPVPRSWDSRYFGPQPVAGIIGLAKPVLILGIGNAACAS